MYRILIVEDNDDEAATLERHLSRYATENGETFEVNRLDSAVTLASEGERSDLVFLDIDLPGISGMEAANLIRTYDKVTPIVFVTNLAQYAVKGYEVDALDFMVKPVGYYDFSMRMDKAMRAMRHNAGRTIVVQTRDGMRVLPLRDLVSVETANHNVIYRLTDGSELEVRESLKKVEENLAHEPFVRISSGCLANMAHIRTVAGSDLVMDTGATLYFSRAKRADALKRIASYLGGSI